ncbi:hypothetical protein PP404_06315 [Mycobacteroides abscessus]|nr:hypothetical protein [Mycobacteroides abscessus]MDM2176020.1 hypothetical protein [Mycobacteroides abscessus]MDM2207082.1 hypothetical protein [Mycobacteroides abscessus]MDM2210176.1 hypothetical protein [Mycobacteroides abscessus]MDM2217358.1 hypothetical protein [Mycobacteroides abscessus]
MDAPALTSELAALLGLQLVAYLGNVKDVRVVRQWADGSRGISSTQDVERMRLALRAALLIMSRDSREVAQAWFQGLNPLLEDVSPARLLCEGDPAIEGPRVLAAARQFAGCG